MDTKAMRTSADFAEHLTALLSKRGIKPSELARAAGVSPQAVNGWLKTGRVAKAHLPSIARALDVSLEALVGGPDRLISTKPANSSTIEAGPDELRLVPVISWVQAGNWTSIVDNFAPGDAEEWLPAPLRCSPRSFVVRVRGVSMEPDLHEGELVLIDPDVPADHGRIVVVRLEDREEATIKRLIVEGGERYLKASNPAWPEPVLRLTERATICGVAVQVTRRL